MILGTKLSFSRDYHPQTDGLEEIMIQILEKMIRLFRTYGLELKAADSFAHNWCTIIPPLELAYKASIHASTGKNSALLKKERNPKLPVDTFEKYSVSFHPTISILKLLLVSACDSKQEHKHDSQIP
ncbi:hypothetical protein O181_054926 [Austropuccinia psidii MF-1]|uniref:Integrase catalytic domain-containing protein n=1 Tax=Austropuccinia psidii MF-1 TaxID=1389203 RepID=A0A9Q3EAC2_9BASI|nr:hypothetical protein [Austropuccinia psidii MF-1]